MGEKKRKSCEGEFMVEHVGPGSALLGDTQTGLQLALVLPLRSRMISGRSAEECLSVIRTASMV